MGEAEGKTEDDGTKLIDFGERKAKVREINLTTEAARAKGAQLVQEKAWWFSFPAEDGTLLEGQFVAQRLTGAQRSRYGVLLARLCGGEAPQSIPVDVWAFNECVAYLSFALKEKPAWFSADTLYDPLCTRVFSAVYQEVTAWHATFR